MSGVAGPVVTLNGTTDGNAASFLSVAVLDTTAGYAGYAQLRVKDTASPAATTWATMEIAIDVAAGTWAQVSPGVTYTSTTTSAPTFSPVSPATNGDSVTLTSTVTPSSATGSVHFFDGSTDLGAATFSGGTATLAHVFTNTTNPKVNETHGITAVYTPTGLFSPSTSSVSNLVVQTTPLISTTNLTLSAGTVAQPGAITATAAVTAGGSAVSSGSVAFYIDGAATPSATVATSAGSASFNIDSNALVAGSHTIVAVYTDGNLYNGSTSSPASAFTVTAPAYALDLQNIQTSIAAGTLDLSTALTISTPLLLPSMTLSTSADEYFSSLLITGLSMTDTRPGNLPYTLSLISTNLNKLGVANPNPNESISGQNVGFNVTSLVSTNATPNTFLGSQNPGASTAGQNFTGFNNAAAAHVQITDTGSQGLGGSTPHPILHANQGTGTTVVAATMTIRAPTNLLDGTYAGTVTFSVLGS